VCLAEFLRDELKLELSQDKTLITHARTGAARFLGYEITVQHNDRYFTRGQRSVNGNVALRVPRSVVKAKIAPYLRRGKPARRTQIINRDDYNIVATYGVEYRGIVQYYLLAGNIQLLHRLRWVMLTSLFRTLASKHHSTVTKVAAKHKATTITPSGPRTCFEAVVERAGRKPLVARFGGIPLKRQKNAFIDDRVYGRSTYPARSWSPGSSKDSANCASTPARCKSTRSANSPTSTRPGPPNPRGHKSWHANGARRSSAAPHAMTTSTSRHPPQNSRRKSLESRMRGLCRTSGPWGRG
jgi:hypothetical protein